MSAQSWFAMRLEMWVEHCCLSTFDHAEQTNAIGTKDVVFPKTLGSAQANSWPLYFAVTNKVQR